MKTKILLVLAACCALRAQDAQVGSDAAKKALAQDALAKTAVRQITKAAEDIPRDLAKAQAEAQRANERRDRAVKKAAEADAALRKVQGRSELTDAERAEVLRLHRNYLAAQIKVLEIPQQAQQAQQEMNQAAKGYEDYLAPLKAAHNAVTCAGVDAEAKWAGCPAK